MSKEDAAGMLGVGWRRTLQNNIDAVATTTKHSTVVVATSRVFGNDWDGGVTAYTEGDDSGKSCHMPCGCTDVAWVGDAAEHVAVACDDGNVVVLELSSMGAEGWRPAHVLADHENIVTSVSACPLALDTFASSSVDQTIKVWSLSAAEQSSDCISTLRGHCCPVWDVEYSPQDRNVLCSVGQDGQMRMWDDRKPDGGPTMTSMPQGSPLFCLSWSSSGDMIATGSENGEVLFFDPRSIEEPLQKWQGHTDSVRRVAMLPGKRVATASDDCHVAIVSMAAGKPVLEAKRKTHTDYVRGLCTVSHAASSDKMGLISCSWDRSLALLTA